MEEKKKIENQLMTYLDYLYQHYSLPKENIAKEEWQIFFDTVYNHIMKHNCIDDYNGVLHILLIRALNNAQKDSSKFFTLYYLIEALDDLICFNIFTDEINEVKEEIRSKTRYGEIYSIKRKIKVKE